MVASGGVLRSSVTDALNRATAYTYGATGAVLTVTDPLNQVTTNVYDVAGQLASTTYSNAATHSAVRTYNAAGRVTKENATLYAYDAAGELTKNGATTQGYDAASQLTTGVVGSTSTAYTFDARGDRTKATTGSVVATYGYDQVNRLTSFARGKTTASYTYNGDGLRASKTVGRTTTKFVYDRAEGLPLVLGDGAYYYLYGPDGVPFEQVTTAGVVTYLHADQLGSIRMITGSTGKSVGTATYTAYGTRTTTGTTSAFGYAGQYTDTETGLQWLRARYYDPTTGQFLTVDPLTAATGARYAYAGGNPITRADPSGLEWWNPLSWTGDTYDNIALGATAVSLVSTLLAAGSAATYIGAPAAAVFGSVATAAEGVAVVASIGGTVQHIREGDTTAAWISATGAIPGVGMAARRIYEARYAPRIAEVGIRTVGRGWRQLAQGVESGTLWGGGLGVWGQNVWNWCFPEYTL